MSEGSQHVVKSYLQLGRVVQLTMLLLGTVSLFVWDLVHPIKNGAMLSFTKLKL